VSPTEAIIRVLKLLCLMVLKDADRFQLTSDKKKEAVRLTYEICGHSILCECGHMDMAMTVIVWHSGKQGAQSRKSSSYSYLLETEISRMAVVIICNYSWKGCYMIPLIESGQKFLIFYPKTVNILMSLATGHNQWSLLGFAQSFFWGKCSVLEVLSNILGST
jgi:hypothetical protein